MTMAHALVREVSEPRDGRGFNKLRAGVLFEFHIWKALKSKDNLTLTYDAQSEKMLEYRITSLR